MTKILFITSLSGKRINNFMLSSILAAKKLGYEFHLASNQSEADLNQYTQDCKEYGIISHHIDFHRNPLHIGNFRAYRQLLKLMRDEKFDIVHCNTPIGGLIGRVCAKRVGTKKTIYMAHGFHFWKGAPILNWILYYPVERFLARYTDALITINDEDYKIANKFKTKKVFHIHGVGINCDMYKLNKTIGLKKREELGIKEDTIVLLSIGELSKRKNHIAVIRAIAKLNNSKILYIICGKGKLENYLKKETKKLGVEKNVRLLGFRSDIPELCAMADVFVFPSYQEGLPIALMEAMAAGMPVICSKIRGNTDLIANDDGGILVEPKNIDGYVRAINKIISNKNKSIKMANRNKIKVKSFELDSVIDEICEIYKNVYLK